MYYLVEVEQTIAILGKTITMPLEFAVEAESRKEASEFIEKTLADDIHRVILDIPGDTNSEAELLSEKVINVEKLTKKEFLEMNDSYLL